MLALIERISLTDLILVFGLAGVAIARIGEGRGWFKSAAGLRTENTDLLRRNADLEATVARHEIQLAENDTNIARLEKSVRELEKRDQAAVLKALSDHEVGAIGRAQASHVLLSTANVLLERMATILESQSEGVT